MDKVLGPCIRDWDFDHSFSLLANINYTVNNGSGDAFASDQGIKVVFKLEADTFAPELIAVSLKDACEA